MFATIKGYNMAITVNIPVSKMAKQLKPKIWKGRYGSITTLDRHGSTWSMRPFLWLHCFTAADAASFDVTVLWKCEYVGEKII